MKCDEAIKILNSEIDFEKTIREKPGLSAHIKGCENCTRELQALLLAQKYLKEFESGQRTLDLTPAVMKSLPEINARILAKKHLLRRVLAEVTINICICFCFIAAILWSYKSGMLIILLDKARPWLTAQYRMFADSIPVGAIRDSIVAVIPAAALIALAYLISEIIFVCWEWEKAGHRG